MCEPMTCDDTRQRHQLQQALWVNLTQVSPPPAQSWWQDSRESRAGTGTSDAQLFSNVFQGPTCTLVMLANNFTWCRSPAKGSLPPPPPTLRNTTIFLKTTSAVTAVTDAQTGERIPYTELNKTTTLHVGNVDVYRSIVVTCETQCFLS